MTLSNFKDFQGEGMRKTMQCERAVYPSTIAQGDGFTKHLETRN